ncbi:MAG: S8 family serine peptidase [Candidatus Omnitrophota bacterium]
MKRTDFVRLTAVSLSLAFVFLAFASIPSFALDRREKIDPPMTLIPMDLNQSSECIPEQEICDGEDNDCDEQIDEDNVCVIQGEFIVKFKSSSVPDPDLISCGATGIGSIDQLNLQNNVSSIQNEFSLVAPPDTVGLNRIYKFYVDQAIDVTQIIEDYQLDPNVEYAEVIRQPLTLGDWPDDPYYQMTADDWVDPDNPHEYDPQYWIHQIELNEDTGWAYADGAGITIAYSDLIDGNHPEFNADPATPPGPLDQLWINEEEFYGNSSVDDDGNGYVDDIYGPCGDTWCDDPIGHGTAIAGVLGAKINNGEGIASMSYGSKLMALGMCNSGGFEYAVNNGVRILSHSCSHRSNSMEDFFEYAYTQKGVLTFVSAQNGNLYSDTLGTLPTAVNAGMTLWDDTRYWSSGHGDGLDVMAPGRKVLTTGIGPGGTGYVFPEDEDYSLVTGTSFSGPITAGLGALLLSYNTDLTPGQLRYLILSSVDDKGDPGWDQYYGYGRINVRKAFELLTAGGEIPEWNWESKITNPRWYQKVAANEGIVEIEGTATSPDFLGYSLDLCEPIMDYYNIEGLENCREIVSSSTPVVNGVLASFNKSAQGCENNKIYLLRLKVTDANIEHYKTYITIFGMAARDIHVPEDYATIQEAMDAAAAEDKIIVAPGTYTINNPNGLVMKENVMLKSSGGPLNTVLVCPGNECIQYDDVTKGHLEGFTIEAAGDYAVRVNNSSEVIVSHNIINNMQTGIEVNGDGEHIITYNSFSYDDFVEFSSAISVSGNGADTIAYNTVESPEYAPVYGIKISGTGNHNILNNTISLTYAGIDVSGDGTHTIQYNNLANNTYAISVTSNQAQTIAHNSIVNDLAGGNMQINLVCEGMVPHVVEHNTMMYGGVGIMATCGNLSIKNNVIQFTPSGAGIMLDYADTSTVANNTVYLPSGGGHGISLYMSDNVLVKNNIVVGPGETVNGSIGIFSTIPNHHTLIYNDVWNFKTNYYSSLIPGQGSVSLDPLFVDAAGGDFHLQPASSNPPSSGSPCIDAGDPGDPYDQENLPSGDRINMGAYGNTNESALSGLWVCGDADYSHQVDIDDVVYLIAYIFTGGPEPVPHDAGDADGASSIDIDDVVYLIAYIFTGGPAPVCGDDEKKSVPKDPQEQEVVLEQLLDQYPAIKSYFYTPVISQTPEQPVDSLVKLR